MICQKRAITILFAACLSLLTPAPLLANEMFTLSIDNETEVDVNVYPSNGNRLILWLACNEGREGTETRSASRLSDQEIEVWLPDFLSAHFLPQGPSSIYKITGREIAAIITRMNSKHPKKNIYLVAGGRANAPLLRGAAEWEKQTGKSLKGIMFYPRLNLLEPAPGNEPVYIEAVGKTRSPVLILEGGRTPNRWGLPHLTAKLKQSGSTVSYQILPKVRGYFYTHQKKNRNRKSFNQKSPRTCFKQHQETRFSI